MLEIDCIIYENTTSLNIVCTTAIIILSKKYLFNTAFIWHILTLLLFGTPE